MPIKLPKRYDIQTPPSAGNLRISKFRFFDCLGPAEFGAGVAIAVCLVSPASAQGNEVVMLRQQLAEQQAKISEQERQLQEQAQLLQALSDKIDGLARDRQDADPLEASSEPSPQIAAAKPETSVRKDNKPVRNLDLEIRDTVGDLNSNAVRAGDFPGSFRIPGGRNVSLAIGGLVKGVAVADSASEASGASFLPAFLGTTKPDTKGGFSLDATLTRLFVDGRAPVGDGLVRGYVEFDLNASNNGSPDFKLRHAYGTWNTGRGLLTVGQTWSTFMDIKILPEGLTEPTVSGAIFNRQAIIRWSQPIGKAVTLHAAIEDPSNTDVTDYSAMPMPSYTRYPDGVLGLDIQPGPRFHVRANGIIRDIRVRLANGGADSELAWGASLSSHLTIGKRDKWVVHGTYGKGLGRYLLGIQPAAGSVIDPATNSLILRENWGVLSAYQHFWNDKFRSSIMAGYARSEPLAWQPGSTFVSSTYASANLMWQVLPFLNVGIEYAYGVRKNFDRTKLDNHRIAFGFQFF